MKNQSQTPANRKSTDLDIRKMRSIKGGYAPIKEERFPNPDPDPQPKKTQPVYW